MLPLFVLCCCAAFVMPRFFRHWQGSMDFIWPSEHACSLLLPAAAAATAAAAASYLLCAQVHGHQV
jgi:hypothetical protein